MISDGPVTVTVGPSDTARAVRGADRQAASGTSPEPRAQAIMNIYDRRVIQASMSHITQRQARCC
jgi:hypothetical protein